LDIYNAIFNNSNYKDNTNIFFLWLDDGNLPDNSEKKRLANIWVSPFFEKGRKIFDRENKNIYLKSIKQFLDIQYLNFNFENDKDIGSLWQPKLLSDQKIKRDHLFDYLKPNKCSYNAGSSPYRLGNKERIEGTAEKIFSKTYFQKFDNDSSLSLEEEYASMKLEEAGIKLQDTETDKNSNTCKKL
jgi:hypothetical protein